MFRVIKGMEGPKRQTADRSHFWWKVRKCDRPILDFRFWILDWIVDLCSGLLRGSRVLSVKQQTDRIFGEKSGSAIDRFWILDFRLNSWPLFRVIKGFEGPNRQTADWAIALLVKSPKVRSIDLRFAILDFRLNNWPLCARFRESNAYASHQSAKRSRLLFSYPRTRKL